MEDREFDRPVQILDGHPGASRLVRSTAEAAEFLLYNWPTKGGRKHHTARQACLEVLEGLREARAARSAFEAAADEANILVQIIEGVRSGSPRIPAAASRTHRSPLSRRR